MHDWPMSSSSQYTSCFVELSSSFIYLIFCRFQNTVFLQYLVKYLHYSLTVCLDYLHLVHSLNWNCTLVFFSKWGGFGSSGSWCETVNFSNDALHLSISLRLFSGNVLMFWWMVSSWCFRWLDYYYCFYFAVWFHLLIAVLR